MSVKGLCFWLSNCSYPPAVIAERKSVHQSSMFFCVHRVTAELPARLCHSHFFAFRVYMSLAAYIFFLLKNALLIGSVAIFKL